MVGYNYGGLTFKSMKITLTHEQAVDMLLNDKDNGYTRAGADAIITYFEAFEEETGENIELDYIAIRCDFSEYSDAVKECGEFGELLHLSPAEALEWLKYRTIVIEFSGGVIIQNF